MGTGSARLSGRPNSLASTNLGCLGELALMEWWNPAWLHLLHWWYCFQAAGCRCCGCCLDRYHSAGSEMGWICDSVQFGHCLRSACRSYGAFPGFALASTASLSHSYTTALDWIGFWLCTCCRCGLRYTWHHYQCRFIDCLTCVGAMVRSC